VRCRKSSKKRKEKEEVERRRAIGTYLFSDANLMIGCLDAAAAVVAAAAAVAA
jgi:hypothetical protein